jgi:hypothetical protein
VAVLHILIWDNGAGTGATATVSPSSTTTYNVTVTDACLATATGSVTVTVNPLPSAAITANPSGAVICGTGSVILNVPTGATTYAWLPATGLSATNTASVTASPTATTTYTVTVTGSNGCTATSTQVVTVATTISATASATPSTVCAGGNTQLNVSVVQSFTTPLVSAYSFASSSGGTLQNMTGATQLLASGNDDTPSASPVNIGFSFNFNGTNYTQYSVSPDGWILLGGTTATSQFTNAVTSTTNIPKIYPFWDDSATGTTGSVQALLTGTSPNRILVVQWNVTIPRNNIGAANSTMQAWLYESSNKVEFRYGTMGTPTSGSISSGMTGGATNFNSITFSTNTASSVTANDANTTAPTSGTVYTFTPLGAPSFTYAWSESPAGSTLAATNIANPMANGISGTTIYTVTVTGNGGCTATSSVTVSAGAALTATPTATPATICAGASTTIAAVAAGGRCSLYLFMGQWSRNRCNGNCFSKQHYYL